MSREKRVSRPQT